MFLSSLVLTSLLAVEALEPPHLTSEMATVELAPARKISPGMTEDQVEKLVGEPPSGIMNLGCGNGTPVSCYIRLYKKGTLLVLFVDGKVKSDTKRGPNVPMICLLPPP